MARLDESLGGSAFAGALTDGIETLDLNQEIKFQAYTRVVLTVDGYIFWQPTVQICVKGALHFSQEIVQEEDETLGFASVTFTSERKVVEFESAPPNTIYVAQTGKFRYAFSQQGPRFKQSGIWHYFGHSIQPAMAAQLLDNPDSIDPTRAVVSNSLPLWLALNGYKSPLNEGLNSNVTLYPSFLTPPNLEPAYGAVHIGPGDTEALQSAPYIDQNGVPWQLVADTVRITLYGLQNREALAFQRCVESYSALTGTFGVMNMPIIVDGKRPQVELQAIAMQKIFTIKISYYQTDALAVSRQMIKKALPISYIFPSA